MDAASQPLAESATLLLPECAKTNSLYKRIEQLLFMIAVILHRIDSLPNRILRILYTVVSADPRIFMYKEVLTNPVQNAQMNVEFRQAGP